MHATYIQDTRNPFNQTKPPDSEAMMSQKVGDLREEAKEPHCDWQSTKETSVENSIDFDWMGPPVHPLQVIFDSNCGVVHFCAPKIFFFLI